MKIQSVVFDYGSVLAWPPSSENCERVAQVAGIPVNVLLERYFLERSAYDRNTINDSEYWRNILRGYPASENQTVLQTLVSLDVEIWSDPNESTVTWLPDLKKAGLTLAILSNMPESSCNIIEKRDRWLDIFDHQIFSGRVGLAKPEPAMYQLLLNILDAGTHTISPENVLFLDDLPANVEGARAVGLNAEIYNVFDGGLSEMADRYGLPAPREFKPSKERLNDFACAPHRQKDL